MSRLFADLAAGIAADVARRADADGVVPRTATFELQRQSAERVRRLYLGRNRAGELAPFDVTAEGRVIPLAPYPQALWAAITAAVRLPVEENAAILTKRLPADVLDVMRKATGNPFAASKRRVVEMVGFRVPVREYIGPIGPIGLMPFPNQSPVRELEVFRPNPLANYEAPHTWVDPNGYRLSDRVWNVAATERAKLDAYLDDAIKQGKGALAMSKELVQFLDPSQPVLKTSKPYGTKASFDAMRLARTEITRAHDQAQKTSAAMNPFVVGLKWVLSPRHPKPDICDSYARGGPNGDGVYPIEECPGLPHPQCLCHRLNAMIGDPDAVIDELRRDIRQARAELVNLIGPLQVDEFDKLLLGSAAPLNAPAAIAPRRVVTPPPPRPVAPAVIPPMAGLNDPTMTLVWGKTPEGQGQVLNGIKLEPATPDYWLKVKDRKFKDEPALPALAPGQRQSTGLVIVEPDGRIWIYEPSGHFGGYEHTFPKGGLEPGLTAQQNALKEVYEEVGLSARITGYLGDFKGSTSTTRYYIATRTGGAPWLSDAEAATVKLAPRDVARKLLNVQRDKDILDALEAKLAPKQRAPRVPKAVPVQAPTTTDEIPGLEQLSFVKKLGGSTGAQLFEDGATGKRYVVKGGANNDHIRSEFLADELYRTMGANVPRARLVQKDGQTFKIAEYIDGKLLNSLTGNELTAAHAQLQKHFAADALLASWDVIGMGADNVIVDAAGKAWRIDNGGSLLFRAQGAPKAMGNYLDELWSLRDAKVNGQTHKVFGDTNYSIIANQLTGIVRQRSDIIGKITDPTLRAIMTARLDHAADLVQIYNTLGNDKYLDSYIDRFSYHNTWIQSTGVTSTLPKRLGMIANPPVRYNGDIEVILEDENGKRWDDLRGDNGIYAKFLAEVDKRTGGKSGEFMERWSSQQGGDSWNALPRYAKQVLEKNRPSTYHTNRIEPYVQAELDNFRRIYSEDFVRDTVAAQNALSYELLRKVDIGARPGPGMLHLFRTESDDVMDIYGFKRIGHRGKITRGAAESTSILSPVSINGGHLTEQDVPIHRVLGFYGMGIDETIYLNDFENELLTLLDGADVTYTRKIR